MKRLIDEFAPRCQDTRCEQRCPLFVAGKGPAERAPVSTLRMDWESHRVQCRRSQEFFGVLGLDEESE